MPFLQLASIHITGNHLSRPIGESSKIVPTFRLNFWRAWAGFAKHLNSLALGSQSTFSEPHAGHLTLPVPQRRRVMNSRQFSTSAKWMIACCKVLICLTIPNSTTQSVVSQVYFHLYFPFS